ncbi:MAG TPA: methyltransferase domain-containing protein [Candidatus Elarobacter sp.]|nr:methyltransferase domain-containing protein [Candidatus Elarobacter sp.]
MSRTSYELTRCPVCDAADSDALADRDAIRAEVERLWAFHEARLRAGTPPEALTDRVAFSQDPPLRLARCRACTHVYRNPRERDVVLRRAYDDALDASVLQSLFDTQRDAYAAQARRLTRVAGKRGRGLEVGSYVGGFLAAARDAGWMFEGVDVGAAASAFAMRQGFRVTQGEITDVTTAHPYDAIAIWNTFEQLYDSRAAVAAARRMLGNGGLLVVRVPNGEFYARWRVRLRGALSPVAERVLAHNNLLGFPYRQGFTRASLQRLLADGGFEVVCTFGDTLVPIADRWTTRYGAIEERLVKRSERLAQRAWRAPWVEVYARVRGEARA